MVSLIALAARVILSAVLLAAGGAKLRDGFAWIRQAGDMGVWPPVARVVPWIEVAVGLAMLPPWLLPWPLWCAGVLLVTFTIVIIMRVADGSRPPCACFGARSQRNLGPRDIARNLGLLALVGVALIAP